MKKIILGLMLIAGTVNATSTPQGYSVVSGTTTSSAPITIATPLGATYFIDSYFKIINPNSSGSTTTVIITSGAVTIEDASPAPGSGGWIESKWFQVHTSLNNPIVLIDTQGIGIQYEAHIWNSQSEANRP